MKVFRPVAAQYRISSPYGSRKDPVTGVEGTFHYGIDFAVPVGTPVVAALTGSIVKSGWQDDKDHKAGFGYRVWQKVYGQNAYIVYAHLSKIAVSLGDSITAGTRIGLSGNTGKSSGPHLHLEVRQGEISGTKGIPIEIRETI